jgi:hypothetical protein
MANAAAALKGILNETVGPMAALTVGALAFVKYTAGAALNAEKMAAALRASGQAKGLENQFKIIMGSADAARKKVAELSREAQRSPFSFQALGRAALNLQVLSNGAFASARALRQVQDVAVATGTPVDAVASAMGDLVGSMKRGGDGAGAAAAQLAAMGAISQAAAQKVADLAAQGAPVGEAMRVVESETSKASGAAAALANTIDGLQAQMVNLQTASDAKIGAMFEEGEKAGLRAAIGFQKFGNAVQEAASGPWAAITAAINSVKEAFGNFLGQASESSGVSAAFRALGVVAIGVLAALAISLAQGAVFLGRLAISALSASKALQALGASMTIWGRLMTTAGAVTVAAAAGLTYFAAQAYEAVNAIDALSEALAKQNKSGIESAAGLRRRSATMVTPEDKQAAISDADAQLELAREEAKKAREAQQAAEQRSADLENGSIFGVNTSSAITRGRARAEADIAGSSVMIADANVQRLETERRRMGGAQLGMDREQDQQARARMALEQQIRDDAYSSAQQAASPQMQARMADAELSRAQERRKRAESDSKVTFEERSALNDATAKVSVDSDTEELRQGLQGIKGVKATTETARLSKEIALRETLKQQMGQAEYDLMAGTPEQKRAAAEKKNFLDQQVTALGGAEEISGARIQDLQRRRDFAASQEDPNAARQAEEAARNQAQAAKEAEAAQKALNAAKEKTLALENQLAGVSGSGSQADEAATKESENRTEALQKALAAAKALEAAQEQYAEARESGSAEAQDKARVGVEEASVAAAAAGVGDRGVAEIQSALSIEQMILQANLQQARITQAAAQARVEAAQRQLNTERMMAQMNLKSAEANVNNTSPQQDQTRAQIESEAAQADIAAEERALAAAKAKEAAEKAMVNNPNEANRRALEAANVAAEAAGVGNRTPAEVQADLDSKRVGAANQEAERIDAAQTEAERIKLASLRAQEQYGPNKEQSRKEADALEDSMAKEARTKELGETIKDPAIAAGLASAEVEMARAMSNIERAGQPEMGEMASVGGSAGYGGLVNDNTKDMKAIKEQAEKIKDLMGTFKTQQDDALTLAKRMAAIAEADAGQ